MGRVRRGLTSATAFGTLAVLAAGIAIVVTLRTSGWNPAALVHVDSRTPLGAAARAIDPGFRSVHPGAYDGQFYWLIGIDPFATGRLHTLVDKPSYRYGHPLYGWLAWIASAGHSRGVPFALALIGLASMFGAAFLAARLGAPGAGPGVAALFVVLNLGLLTAAANDLAEPLAAALLLGALAAYRARRLGLAWCCLALLPLAKEPLVLVLVAFVCLELVRRRFRRAALLATAALPALGWWVYARVALGAWFTSGDTALGRPLGGWWSAILGSGVDARAAAPVRAVATSTLVVLLLVLGWALVRALRLRGPADYAYLALAPVALCLAPNATGELTTALRNTAFLLVLAPLVLARPPRQAAARVAAVMVSGARPDRRSGATRRVDGRDGAPGRGRDGVPTPAPGVRQGVAP